MILAIRDLLGKTYDTMYNSEPYLALCNPALDVICPLGAYTDLTLDAKINEISELNLCVHKYTETGELNPCYGYIEKRKYIFVKGVGYFRISECSEQNTGDDDIKKVITAESKEAELANINVPDLGEDVEKTYVDARGETRTYRVTSYTLKLYDEDEQGNRSRCLISVIESVLKNWTFVLSPHFKTLAMASSAYTFGTSEGGQESIGENVYNFLTTTVADAYDVVFLFDVLNSQIYPIYREEYYDKTSLFFDRANIIESITKNEKKDTFCTCLALSITDELRPYLMAANPTGMYLYDFSYFIDNNDDMKWMNNTIKARIQQWETEVEAVSSTVDAQALRCLEAWNTELSMRELAKKNEDLYDKQSEALKTALNGIDTREHIETLETYYTNSAVQGSVLSQIGAAKISGAQTTYENVTIGECEKRIQMLRSLTHAMYYPETVTGQGLYDMGTYVNSTFNIEHVANGSDLGGYHVWTPKFRVFQNTGHYNEARDFPWAANTNELATSVIASFAYTKSGTWDFPWATNTDELATDEAEGYILSLDTDPRRYTYMPFPDDSDGQYPAPTAQATADVTGATMRLHFYHYDEVSKEFFKLHMGDLQNDLYLDYSPPINPQHDITDTADIVLTNLPTTGRYYIETTNPSTGNTEYELVPAEVNYMRMELFINDPFLVTAFTVTDARLWYYVLVNHLLDFNSDEYLPENYFTPEEYAQVSRYIETLSYSNDNIVVTEYDDMAEREQLALDFLAKAKEQIKRTVTPIMECSVDSGSEIFSDEYEGIRNELTLGSFARVEFDDNQYAELPLMEININWQECSFGMTFGTFRKQGSRWSDLLSQTLSAQRAVDVKATEAYSFVKDNTLGTVKEALIGGMNTNKMRLYSSETAYELNEYGATWTSVDKDENKYQIVIADGTVACVVTDANGLSEVKTALGKYIYQPDPQVPGVIRYGVFGGAIIAESITADKIAVGAIGGWTISSDHMIHKTSNNKTDGLIAPAGETVADNLIGVNTAGNIEWEMLLGTKLNFGVDKEGNLYAKDANISGTVNAGKVGGWIIDGTSIRNTDGASVNPSVFVSLISNGIIPSGQNGVGRTLIGNFICGPDTGQTSGINMPNYIASQTDTHTWMILSGANNTFRFGVTKDGELYTRDIISSGSLVNLIDSTQATQSRTVDAVGAYHLTYRVLIGNYDQKTSASTVIFPNGLAGAQSYTNWQILAGSDNALWFGVDTGGNAYLSPTSQLRYGVADCISVKNLVERVLYPNDATTSASGLMSAADKLKMDARTATWTNLTHRGQAGFNDLYPTFAEKVTIGSSTFGVLYIRIQRTSTENPISKNTFAYFASGLPKSLYPRNEQIIFVKSEENKTFMIKIQTNPSEGKLFIAGVDEALGASNPQTIKANIWYQIS